MSDYGFSVEKGDSDTWHVYLPHQCDEWDITLKDYDNWVPHADAVENLEAFIVEAQAALTALKEGQDFGSKRRW